MSNTNPYDGWSSTTTGDPSHFPSANKCKHMITKIVNKESVTIWYYRFNITHNINKDGTNHLLSVKRLLDTISINILTVFVTHHKVGGKLT